MKITLEFLKEKSACQEGVDWFKSQKETDSIKVLLALSKADKWPWANWLIVRLMDHPTKVKYAIFAAEQVISIYEKKYPNDKRPRNAIKAAKAWVKNPNDNTKKAAAYAAYAAYAAAYAAYAAAYAADAAYAAAYAAYAADAAAYAAAYARNKLRQKILNYGISLLEKEGGI